MFKLNFTNLTPTKISKNIFQQALKSALKRLKQEKKLTPLKKNLLIELTLVCSRRMAVLNKRFLGKNQPTDVISLSFFEKNMKDNFVGEIFICVPYARKQAKALGLSFYGELKFLFIHGLLHLFGYVHKKATEALHMQKLTHKVLD